MSNTMEASVQARPALRSPRLHHNAYVVVDQERTRAFYEDLLGMPLTQFWIEKAHMNGQFWHFSHAFYGLEDGSALAFFCMATPESHERFKSPPTEVFNHIALALTRESYDALIGRLDAAGYKHMEINHGYCQSLYVTDPDGLRLEFAVDSPDIESILEDQRRTAHQALKGWTQGNTESNNTYARRN